MTCPVCGRDNLPGASRCAKCGKLLPEAGAATPPPPAPDPGGGGATSVLPAGVAGTSGSFAPGARLEAGTFIGQRYQIEATLGEGGMGMVYRAHDRELNRKVALKVIRPELASHPEILERFKREILLASKVTHKNVVRLHDLGEAGDLRFLSMSYIDGESLKALLEREGPLSPERGVPILRGIAEALLAAHEAGVVHRDLKPHNVLVDKEGNPYVGDFGISRSMTAGDGTMTETGAILGTVDYMSPEQARGDVPDQRSDIYSLGVMMFEMFTGTLPFRAANPLSVMVKRVHEDVPSPTQVRPGIPPWLNAIMLRALARDPKVRYQSVAELIRDLDRQRATRARRRLLGKRAAAAAAALVAAGLLLAGTVSFLRHRTTAAPAVKTSLAILPVRNETADAHYDWVPAGATSLLRSGLVQARALRLTDDARTQEILDILKPAPGDEARPATAQRLGRLAGVDHVLTASLLRVGTGLRLQANLIPSGEGAAAAAKPLVVDGEGDAALPGMLDSLAGQVRESLGVARAWGEGGPKSGELSTRSVEALSAYGEALAQERKGDLIQAVDRLKQATTHDPSFALGWALLAQTDDRLGRQDEAKSAGDLAVSHLKDASPWEAARVRAIVADVKGDPAAAAKELETIVAAAPNDPQSLLDLARAQEDAGDLAGARRTLSRTVALDPGHAGAQFALGKVLARQGEMGPAGDAFKTALSRYQELGSRQGQSDALNGLGNVALDMGQNADAETHYRKALDIRRAIGDTRGVTVCLANLALTSWRTGHTDEAIRLQQEAIDTAKTLGDPGRIAWGYQQLGDIQQGTGRTDAALASYQESLKILRESGDDTGLAKVLTSMGYVDATLGKYVEAYFFMKEALAKTRASGDQARLVEVLIDIGALEQVQGRYDQALAYYDEGLTRARQADYKEKVNALTMNTAQVHEDQGNYGAALKLLNDTVASARNQQNQIDLATALTFLGSVRLRAGDVEGSGTSLTEAIRVARAQNNENVLAEALTYDGERLMIQGDRAAAAAALKEANEAAVRAGDFRLQRTARLARARLELSRPDLERVLKDAQDSGLQPLVAPALLALARLDQQSGALDGAASRAHAAAESASHLGERDWLAQARHLEGQVLARQGKDQAALEMMQQALPPYEEMRKTLEGPALAAFLARPETSGFGRDAAPLFASSPADRGRLDALMKP
jgi:tetratricopeptide (TPR) repeat protein/TolB-like protein/predicted Ser/Thr protein kinase